MKKSNDSDADDDHKATIMNEVMNEGLVDMLSECARQCRLWVRETLNLAWMEMQRMNLHLQLHLPQQLFLDLSEPDNIASALKDSRHPCDIWSNIQRIRSQNILDEIHQEASILRELSDDADDIVQETEQTLKEYLALDSNFQTTFPLFDKQVTNVGESRLKAIKKSLSRAGGRANIQLWQECEALQQDEHGVLHLIQHGTRQDVEIFLSQDWEYESKDKHSLRNIEDTVTLELSLTMLMDQLFSTLHNRRDLLTQIQNLVPRCLDLDLHEQPNTMLDKSGEHICPSYLTNHMDFSNLQSASLLDEESRFPSSTGNICANDIISLLQRLPIDTQKLLKPLIIQVDHNIHQQHSLIHDLRQLTNSHHASHHRNSFTTISDAYVPHHTWLFRTLSTIFSLKRRCDEALEFYQTILPHLIAFRTHVIECSIRSATRRSDFEADMKLVHQRKKQSMEDEDVAMELHLNEVRSWNTTGQELHPLFHVNTALNHRVTDFTNISPTSHSISNSDDDRSIDSQTFQVNDSLLAQFLTMDFAYDDVIEALQQSHNDFDVAFSYLLKTAENSSSS